MAMNPCLLLVGSVIAAGFSILFAASLHAQQYPVKPIRIISTTTAGRVNDTICRAYAAVISQASGQNVIVENRPGGGRIIIGSANLPANNFREVIAFAEANHCKHNFATWGSGSIPAIYAAWTNRQNDVDIQPIAYKGAVPSIGALLSGEVYLTYQSLGFVLPNIRAGKLKSIAIAGHKRSPHLPEVAALGESNSDPNIESIFGVYAPGKPLRRSSRA